MHTLGRGHQDSPAAFGEGRLYLGDGPTLSSCGIVGSRQQFKLVLDRHVVGKEPCARRMRPLVLELHDRRPTTTGLRHRGGCGGGLEEATLGEICGVSETCGVADDHSDACATLLSRGQLLHLSIVQDRGSRRPILTEDLRHLTSSGDGGGEHALEDVWGNEVSGSGHPSIVSAASERPTDDTAGSIAGLRLAAGSLSWWCTAHDSSAHRNPRRSQVAQLRAA